MNSKESFYTDNLYLYIRNYKLYGLMLVILFSLIPAIALCNAGETFFDQYKRKLILEDSKYSSLLKEPSGFYKEETLNEMGDTSKNSCFHGDGSTLFIHSLLKPYNNPVVIDIGSGLGGCSKTMGFLGYKVFSIDLSPIQIEIQKKNYCTPLTKGLIYKLAEIDGYSFSKERFQKDCKEIKARQIFEHGNFNSTKIKSKLPLKKWDIVLAHNVFQFMATEDLKQTLKLISQMLSKNGLFSIVYTNKNAYKESDSLINYHDNYNALNNILEDLSFNIILKAEENNTVAMLLTLNNKEEVQKIRNKYQRIASNILE